MNEMDKYYQILGLNPGASEEEIKQAYKDLVNVWHPDRFSNNPRLREKAEEKLKEINLAYEVLGVYIAGKSESFTASEGRRTHTDSQPPPREPPPKSRKEQSTTAGDEGYGGFQPPPEQPFGKVPTKSIYAGFWNRFAALFIDSVIVGIGGLILYLPFLIAKGMSNISSYSFWIVLGQYERYLVCCREVKPISESEFDLWKCDFCGQADWSVNERKSQRFCSKCWERLPVSQPEGRLNSMLEKTLYPPRLKSISEIWPDWLPTLNQESMRSTDLLTQILVCHTIKRAEVA